MSNSKLNDEIFDALLKEALSQLEEEKVKEKNRELEQIDTSDYVPSKKFLRNLRREYFRYSVKNTLKSKALRKVASFVLMAGVVSGGLCFWAEANGIPVYETIFLCRKRTSPLWTIFIFRSICLWIFRWWKKCQMENCTISDLKIKINIFIYPNQLVH